MRYEVFTRIEAGDDIQHIGRIEASNARLAKLYARTTFDEENWNYMAVVAARDLHEVMDEHETPSPEVDA